MNEGGREGGTEGRPSVLVPHPHIEARLCPFLRVIYINTPMRFIVFS